MPDVIIDGVRIAYDIAGNSSGQTPLLLLHEMTATKDEWAEQVAHFAHDRLVVAPNAVGYPPSQVPEDVGCYTIERQVGNAIGLLSHLGIPRAHVMGHSMGAHTALEMALRHPEVTVSAVILGGGSGQTNRAGFQEQCRKKADELERDGMAALVDYSKGMNRRRFEMRFPEAYRAYMDAAQQKHSPRGRANTLRGFQAQRPSWYEQEDLLRSCEVPVLVVAGDEDEPCVEPGLFLKRVMPRCGVLVMPQTGHTVQVEEAARLNRLLAEFLADVEGSTQRWARLEGYTSDVFSASFKPPPPRPFPRKGPLEGFVVVDLTRIMAGPYSTRILHDLGATIIKVEDPKGGDVTRTLAPYGKSVHKSANSSYFAQLNPGKESITLDLKVSGDKEIFEKLLAKADVLVENFRPGVMDRLGYGWSTIHTKYPRIVMASVSGFGQTGPMSQLGAVDPVIQGMSGIVSLTGPPEHPTGYKAGPSISDIVAGIYCANGIQAALLGRERTGKGAYVDISMLDCSVTLNTIQVGQYFANNRENPPRLSNAHSAVGPQDIFRCAEGTVIFVAASADKDFIKMLELVGRADLAQDERFKGTTKRLKNGKALKAELEPAFITRKSQEWCDMFFAAQIPCGPVQSIDEMTQHPQVLARNMVLHTNDKNFLVTGNPIKISGYEDITSRPEPPPLDSGRSRILSKL